MDFSGLYKSLMLVSPKLEVVFRCFYWNNVKWFRKFRNYEAKSPLVQENDPINFDRIIEFLKSSGIMNGDTIVVHSSYSSVSGSGLSPEEIINKLMEVVGNQGTLAMPAIRHFPEEGEGDEYLLNYISDSCGEKETLYDVYRSTISSGLLPFTLMRYDDAEISRFPLNPLVSIGVHASDMMQGNISGDSPSAHGPNSAWKYCAELNAWNVGIGVNLKDYLTMFHIVQETNEWPVRDDEWYFERDFIVKEGRKKQSLHIKERKHKWTKYFAEINFYNDLQKDGIIKSTVIDNVEIHLCRSKDLIDYIAAKVNPTYPYLIPSKYLKKTK